MSPVKFASLPGAPAPIIPENSDNSQCAHLNFCSRVGKCEGGVCVCPLNYLGLDCSIPTGCPANCSNNGVCEVNKCICYDVITVTSQLAVEIHHNLPILTKFCLRLDISRLLNAALSLRLSWPWKVRLEERMRVRRRMG
ncbi:EGF-like domain protein, partial [Ancylostoma duodenale]